ncbi:hypothetical protein BDN72DRAFT_748762, partial [Pluteus cervinus]
LHRRLGHVNYAYIKTMISKDQITGIKLNSDKKEVPCDTCLKGKARRAPVESERITPLAETFGEHLHIDIWGPATVQTTGHHKYALTILDDHS